MTPVFSGFRSAPGVGDVEFLQERRHQDRVTYNVTIVHVPLICQAPVCLQRVLRVVGSSKLLQAAKAGSWLTPAFWLRGLLAIAVVLKGRQH